MNADFSLKQPYTNFKQDIESNEKMAIKRVKNEWKDDKEEEFARIQAKKIIPDDVVLSISKSSVKKTTSATIAIGRAHEIMALYKKSHFIFAHGKCYYLSLVDDFIKEVIRFTQPESCRSLFKHVRLPNVSSQVRNYQDFYHQFQPDNESFTDNAHRKHLTASDWDLQNRLPSESALHFFISNENIMMRAGDYSIRRLLKKNLKESFKNRNIRHRLVKEVCNFIKKKNKIERKDESNVGAYYLFCIPKAEVEEEEKNFVYLSHEYGKPCEHYKGNTSEVIDGLQNNSIEKVCEAQVRILTGPLEKSGASRVFRFSVQEKMKGRENKAFFRKLIHEAVLADRSLNSENS